MRKNKSIQYISFYGIYIGIMAILTFVPYVGFITLGPISLTILHVPVLVFAYLFGIKHGWLFGLIFGALSLIKSATQPAGLLDPYFVNPLLSILPRVLFGFIAGLVFELIKRIKNRKTKAATIFVSAAVLTLLHTCMVFLMLAILQFNALEAALGTSFLAFFSAVLLTSALPEMALAAVATWPIVFGLIPAYNQVFKANLIL